MVQCFDRFRRGVAGALTIAVLSACGSGDTNQQMVTLPPVAMVAESTEAFFARTSSGTGSIDLMEATERVIFSGCLRKNKTSDPRTLGSAAFLTNLTGIEYRLVDFSYVMDTGGILQGEGVETDVGFTVLPKKELVALNSGEELFITHRYDVRSNDRGVKSIKIPQGGFAIKSDQRLSIGSVSAIFPLDGTGARVVNDERLADGSLFRVCYSATVVRSDLVPNEAVVSYRSPFRDRSYVADPARTTAPFTSFRNTSDRPVRIYGIGSFLSNMSSTEFSSHRVDVLVDEKLVTQIALPDHVPGENSKEINLVDPVEIVIYPGSTLTVKGRVFPKKAIVFDYAAFIFADKGLVPVNESFNIVDIDFNGDGFNDIVDLDSSGSIWVSIRVGQGLQNTQTEWVRNIKAEKIVGLPRNVASDPIALQAKSAIGLCLNMTAFPADFRFMLEYCTVSGPPSLPTDVWGDYNGDGFIDRLRVDASINAYFVALGSPQGLGTPMIWAGGFGAVEKMFVSDADGDGKSDVMAEWVDTTGRQCRIFFGGAVSFRVANCPS